MLISSDASDGGDGGGLVNGSRNEVRGEIGRNVRGALKFELTGTPGEADPNCGSEMLAFEEAIFRGTIIPCPRCWMTCRFLAFPRCSRTCPEA